MEQKAEVLDGYSQKLVRRIILSVVRGFENKVRTCRTRGSTEHSKKVVEQDRGGNYWASQTGSEGAGVRMIPRPPLTGMGVGSLHDQGARTNQYKNSELDLYCLWSKLHRGSWPDY